MPLRFALVASLAPAALSTEETQYSTNAICRQNNCINPVFPGLSDLELLETFQWQCSSYSSVREYLTFCKDAVNYAAAIPNPMSNTSLRALVQAQDTAALTAYVYHLAGMNLEAAHYKHPENSDNDCIRETWKLICHTYFPKAEAGCTSGTASPYMRPCKNVCSRYVDACQVRCCDESAKCVFEDTVALADGTLKTETAYVDEEGPASTCTGAATRTAGGATVPLLAALFSSLLLPGGTDALPSLRSIGLVGSMSLMATMLQGCDYLSEMGHTTANWEDKPSYYTNFKYIPPGRDESQAVLNSCSVPGLDPKLQCNGNGVCKPFNQSGTTAVVDFCQCYRDWADPECRTQRKSQYHAFMLSLFGGIIGLDRFYLGQFYAGFGKLSTAGGLGIWWIWDLVRIGSAPVYATDYRLAADLPHALFVVLTIAVFALLGYLYFGYYGQNVARKKRMKQMLLEAEDEFFRTRTATVDINPTDKVGMPGKSSYGTMVPVWDINQRILQQVRQSSQPNTKPGQLAGAGGLAGGGGAASVAGGAGSAAGLQRSASRASGAGSLAGASAAGGGGYPAAAGGFPAAGGVGRPGGPPGGSSPVEDAVRARIAAQAAGGPPHAGMSQQPGALSPGTSVYSSMPAGMTSPGGQPGVSLAPYGSAQPVPSSLGPGFGGPAGAPAGAAMAPMMVPGMGGLTGAAGAPIMAPGMGGPAGAAGAPMMMAPGAGAPPGSVPELLGGMPPGAFMPVGERYASGTMMYPDDSGAFVGLRPAPLGNNINVVEPSSWT